MALGVSLAVSQPVPLPPVLIPHGLSLGPPRFAAALSGPPFLTLVPLPKLQARPVPTAFASCPFTLHVDPTDQQMRTWVKILMTHSCTMKRNQEKRSRAWNDQKSVQINAERRPMSPLHLQELSARRRAPALLSGSCSLLPMPSDAAGSPHARGKLHSLSNCSKYKPLSWN